MPRTSASIPTAPIAAHVLGFANLDNIGIAGIEKYIDGQGLADLHGAGFQSRRRKTSSPIATVARFKRRPMRCATNWPKASSKFQSQGGAAAILDVNTGEVVAMASLPDFDPNNPTDALDPNHINRLTVGVYEMGSTFKAISIAMALDSGKVNLNSRASTRATACAIGRFTIHDFHADATAC